MDESYIHQDYHRNDDSLCDPNNDQNLQYGRAPAKGRLYYFAATIQSPDPRGDVLTGLVPGTGCVFCLQRTGGHVRD